jgi:hypothetical protein
MAKKVSLRDSKMITESPKKTTRTKEGSMQAHSLRLWATLLVTAVGLSACGMLQRDPRTGYTDSDAPSYRATDFYKERELHKETTAREEMGWDDGRALSDDEQDALETRMKLKKLESKLDSTQEKRQYYRLKGVMRSDGERIAFLKIPTVDARERWSRNRGLGGGAEDIESDAIASIIEKNDVAIGMSQRAVVESWGDPDSIETAGDPVYGNERWRYSRYVASNDGYQKQNRVIYFESGRVAGWETQ